MVGRCASCETEVPESAIRGTGEPAEAKFTGSPGEAISVPGFDVAECPGCGKKVTRRQGEQPEWWNLASTKLQHE